jgi:hypothetical protein
MLEKCHIGLPSPRQILRLLLPSPKLGSGASNGRKPPVCVRQDRGVGGEGTGYEDSIAWRISANTVSIWCKTTSFVNRTIV